MNELDKFFKKYSYKFPKGYPDLNDEQDINLLADLLENLGINLKEAEASEFDTFVQNKKGIKPEFKNEVISKLSDEQKTLILKEKSDNINKVISFLNSHQDIATILTSIRDTSPGVNNMGPGEIAIIVCSTSGEKIGGGNPGDINIADKKYEVKEGVPIRAGGTYLASIERLTTTLWNLKQVFEGENAEKYKEVLGSELFDEWKSLSQTQKTKGEINFTNIAKEKLTVVRSLFVKLRKKIIELSSEDTAKPNIITVGSKDFEVDKDELNKIAAAEPGDDIALKGKVVLSKESENRLTKIRQDLKVLLSSNILTSDETTLNDSIKREFIDKYDGLVHVIKTKYTLYSPEQFMENWEFIGVKQGNRPIFALKGTKLTEEEEYD